MSAVVVDLPLVPVMAMKGASGACAMRSRQNSSMSPMTSTPAPRAQFHRPVRLRMRQRHARRQHEGGEGRPSRRSRRSRGRRCPPRPPWPRFRDCRPRRARRRRRPSAPARSRGRSRRGRRARRVLPAKERGRDHVTSPQLQGGEADQRQHDRDDPEADHDLALGPAELLEMVVDRRHQEHALAGELEGRRPG